jgi:hypothetical protein
MPIDKALQRREENIHTQRITMGNMQGLLQMPGRGQHVSTKLPLQDQQMLAHKVVEFSGWRRLQ